MIKKIIFISIILLNFEMKSSIIGKLWSTLFLAFIDKEFNKSVGTHALQETLKNISNIDEVKKNALEVQENISYYLTPIYSFISLKLENKKSSK